MSGEIACRLAPASMESAGPGCWAKAAAAATRQRPEESAVRMREPLLIVLETGPCMLVRKCATKLWNAFGSVPRCVAESRDLHKRFAAEMRSLGYYESTGGLILPQTRLEELSTPLARYHVV